MDRLIALVLLRWRMDLRGLSRRRERVVGLVLMVPFLAIFSLLSSVAVYVTFRGLTRADPEAALAVLSALATFAGISWALSPLVTGIALSETHDVSRLLHFPIPLATLATSSLIANLVQPVVVAELPIVFAAALATAEELPRLPLTLAGVLLTFAFVLAAAHATGLALHGLSRNRRFHDLALFLGLGFGFLMSFGPILLLSSGKAMRPVLRMLQTDVFMLSPFAWGVRAAVYGGRGDAAGFLGYAGLAMLALVAAIGSSVALLHRVHRGELNLGVSAAGAAARARMVLPGAVGALVEKDLRSAWRDPALKATLFMGLLGPILFLLFLTGGGRRSASGIFFLAIFVGVSGFGGNAFGFERRGISLLMGFPVERWRILVGKNLGALVFRLPGLFALVVAGLIIVPLHYLPAALTMALVTMTIGAGVDNYVSILLPTAVPHPGQNPYGRSASGRGLGGVALGALLMMGAVAVASPFILLAWLPPLLDRPWLWVATLPLALAGAGSVYAMLVAGASALLVRREPQLMERILEEA